MIGINRESDREKGPVGNETLILNPKNRKGEKQRGWKSMCASLRIGRVSLGFFGRSLPPLHFGCNHGNAPPDRRRIEVRTKRWVVKGKLGIGADCLYWYSTALCVMKSYALL